MSCGARRVTSRHGTLALFPDLELKPEAEVEVELEPNPAELDETELTVLHVGDG